MEHNSRKILQSSQLLDHARGNNHVAEEPAGYSVIEASADASVKATSNNKPGTADVPPAASTAGTAYTKHSHALRLAMALVEGTQKAATDRQASVDQLRTLTQRASGRACPVDTEDDDAVVKRLHKLVRANDRNLAEQLSLYLDIDERELWRKVGCRDCVHWMDRELGIHRSAAYERLRAARALRSLPVIESLFALGTLGWSKVRELTRIATPDNEQELAAAALELGASETLQMCQRWRHAEPGPVAPDDAEPGAPYGCPTDIIETA